MKEDCGRCLCCTHDVDAGKIRTRCMERNCVNPMRRNWNDQDGVDVEEGAEKPLAHDVWNDSYSDLSDVASLDENVVDMDVSDMDVQSWSWSLR